MQLILNARVIVHWLQKALEKNSFNSFESVSNPFIKGCSKKDFIRVHKENVTIKSFTIITRQKNCKL